MKIIEVDTHNTGTIGSHTSVRMKIIEVDTHNTGTIPCASSGVTRQKARYMAARKEERQDACALRMRALILDQAASMGLKSGL